MNTVFLLADVSALENGDLYEALFRQLPAARQEKVLRYRFPKDRFLSVGAGTLLREALRRAGLEETPEISVGIHGKPFFAGQPELHFNLSHSGTVAACVLSPYEAGCDVEQRRGEARQAAERFLNPDERLWLDTARDDEERERMFFRLWTMKESFMKVTGRGFSLELKDFSVIPGPDGALLRQDADPRSFVFKEYGTVPGYALSLCLAAAAAEDLPLEPERLEPAALR